MSPTSFPVLDRAHAALVSVAAGIGPDQLAAPTPCSDWTVAQVLQHAAGDQRAYAQAITGTEGPDGDPFAPSGELATSVEALVGPAVAASAGAFATVDPDATTPVPVPPGQLAGSDAATAAALDAGVHAWDLAVATGRPSPLDDDLAGPLLDLARQIVEPLRQWGAYAAVVPADPTVEPAEPVVDELLRYLGRDPRWAPPA
ncbi:TIGR03086 family metal-binding protein [Luteimicrobium sp. DT211]|uniref:TIGR03086 family metal-binding protein n=1 Tax=Luteimicrobium sp. DT211 TaxID=3393412 RepID=UPI003CEC3D1F